MAVSEPFRNQSKAEFLKNFHNLRKEVNKLMMRDFGIKPRRYNVDMLKDMYDIDEDDAEMLNLVSEKYGMKSYYTDKYPEWRIVVWQKEVSKIMSDIGVCIEQGNSRDFIHSIYPQATYLKRTEYFEDAIGHCHALKDKFHEILDVCDDVKVGQYTVIAKMLEREIKLLKGVKRSDKAKLNNQLMKKGR